MCWVFYDQLKIVVMIVIISLKEQFNDDWDTGIVRIEITDRDTNDDQDTGTQGI